MARNKYLIMFTAFLFTSAVMFAGCSGCSTEDEPADEPAAMEEMEKVAPADDSHEEGAMADAAMAGAAAEMQEVGHDEGGGEGEESGEMIDRFEELDQTMNGAHLILKYNEEANTFYGTVMNMGTATLESVRIEVHLSNGTEIGPTEPVNLVNGQSMDVTLAGPDEAFVSWNAHVEVGEGEH